MGLWAYDLDKALFSFECIFKIVDLVIDKCISQVQLIYKPGNAMECWSLHPSPTRQHKYKNTAMMEFHRALVDAYVALLAIEHSYERKLWTYPTLTDLKLALELHRSDEWDDTLAPRTYSLMGVGPVNKYPAWPDPDVL